MTRIATYEDALALGLGEHWPADLPRTGGGSHGPARGAKATPATPGGRPRVKAVNALGQNKTEAAFDAVLADLKRADRVLDYQFELLKWRLAPRTWLTLDFAVWLAPKGQLIGIDVKGYLEDDAAVKLKVLADRCRHLPVYLASRTRQRWEFRHVGPSGIVPCDAYFLMGLAGGVPR